MSTPTPASNQPAPNDPAATNANTPTSNPVLRRALLWGGLLALVILIVACTVGGIVAGGTGVLSAVIGTGIAVVFMGITAATILLANRYASTDAFVGVFFGIVMGGWLVKFIVFLVLVVALKDQPWIDPTVLFLSLIAGVIGSLVVDVVVVARSRMPYVSDASLPRSSTNKCSSTNK